MTAQTILPANSVTGGFEVANSVRLDGASAYMTKEMDTPTNADKYTFSFWVKRSKIGAQQSVFRSTNGNAHNDSHVTFQADDTLRFEEYGGQASIGKLQTNQLFKDVSAWYHIVLIYDSGNGTAGNRMRMYVNGTEVTSFGTDNNPSQNADSYFNKDGEVLSLGRTQYSGGGNYFNGYVAEVVMCDGQALAADQFGEFDEDSGIWKPIDVSGLTFGNNGFYLDFEASGNLGNDVNGGTDFGESGLAATDQSLDTCSNNFNTYNPTYGMQAIRVPTFAEGNLKITGDGDSQHHQVMGTFIVNKGKWYWEAKFTVNADIGKNKVGIMSVDLGTPQTAEIVDQSGSCVFVNEDGGDFRRDNATVDQNSGVFTQNQIIGVALNMDDGEISIYRDNSLIVDALDIGNADGTYVTPASVHYRDAGMEFNFGSPPYALTSAAADGDGFGSFEFAPPSGYFSLCSKNLAEYG